MIKIVSWTEDIYYNLLKIKKCDKVIYEGESHMLVSREGKKIRLELNYGKANKVSTIFLKKIYNKFYSVPDLEKMFFYDYQYEILEFSKYNLLSIFLEEEEIENIEKLTSNDIITSWLLRSSFKDYYTNIEDYISSLIGNIYYIDDEKMNKDIKKSLNKILSLKEEKIISIDDLELENINIYLNSGIVWEALFRDKNGNVYLNIGCNISIKIS